MSNQYATLWLNMLAAVAAAAPTVLAPLAATLPASYFMWLSAVIALLNIGLNAWRVQSNAAAVAQVKALPEGTILKTKAIERINAR